MPPDGVAEPVDVSGDGIFGLLAGLDLPRFRSGLLTAILAIKGRNHGLRQIWPRFTSREFRRDAVQIAHQRFNTASACV